MAKLLMSTAAIRTGIMSIVMGICLPASAVTMAEALMLANRSESALPAAQRTALVEAQSSMAAKALHMCASQLAREPIQNFTVVAQLDSHGKVIATWRTPKNAFTTCFGNVMTSDLLYVPSIVPFYTAFEYSSTK